MTPLETNTQDLEAARLAWVHADPDEAEQRRLILDALLEQRTLLLRMQQLADA